MTGHGDLLINQKKAVCEREYLYICMLKFKITPTGIKTIGYLFKSVRHILNTLHCLSTFFKINLFKKFFQEHYQC